MFIVFFIGIDMLIRDILRAKSWLFIVIYFQNSAHPLLNGNISNINVKNEKIIM